MNNRTLLIFLLMVILLAVYVACALTWDYDMVSTIVATAIAAMGIFGVWFQLRKEATIKEAEFLMNFNFAFITNEKFVGIEHLLEKAFQAKKPLVLPEEKRQDLIDYLVYLESLAPLVLNKMVRLNVIDDLFGYRYFIAVNNPGVQEMELCKPEYAPFYRGCYRLYDKWKTYRLKNGLDIPLEETQLDQSPMYETIMAKIKQQKHSVRINQPLEW